MKEINLAAIITENRRKKGVTQDELAAYIGVSKASVSKWETGHSYPDITFLPILAAYFDISIDGLMGYSPQLDTADIEKLYSQLAAGFAQKPFDDALADCEATIKKYYSCYLLLYYMVVLYLNHSIQAPTPEKGQELCTTAIQLCERIKENSKDAKLVEVAVNMQATCYLQVGNGQAVLDLLGENVQTHIPSPGMLISQAFKILGHEDKSQEVLQAELFSKVLETFHGHMVILQNNLADLEKAEKFYARAEKFAELYNMRWINANNMIMLYILGAQMYQLGNRPEKALELLGKYVDVCVNGFFPFKVNGDEFFDKLDAAIARDDDPQFQPRDEASVKESMLQELQSSVFQPLQDKPEYTRLIEKLKEGVK